MQITTTSSSTKKMDKATKDNQTDSREAMANVRGEITKHGERLESVETAMAASTAAVATYELAFSDRITALEQAL